MYTNTVDGDIRTVDAFTQPRTVTLKAVWGYDAFVDESIKHADHGDWELLNLRFPGKPFPIIREAVHCPTCNVTLYAR